MKKSLLLPPSWTNVYLDRRNVGNVTSPDLSVFFPGDTNTGDFSPPRLEYNGEWTDWHVPEGFKVTVVHSRDRIEASSPKRGKVSVNAHREKIDVAGVEHEIVKSMDISGACIADAAVLSRSVAWDFAKYSPSARITDDRPFSEEVCRYLGVKLLEKYLHDNRQVYEDACARHWKDALKLLKQFEIGGRRQVTCVDQYFALDAEWRNLCSPVFDQFEAISKRFLDPSLALAAVMSELRRQKLRGKKSA